MKNQNVEHIILGISILLEKKEKNNDFFVEPEMELLINELFKFSNEIIERKIKEIKLLFEKIICMNKSTGAYNLYERLFKSDFSFAEELLIYAIDNEPYYNNNDDAFVCYILKASRGTPINSAITIFILETKISEGHFWSYQKIFNKAHELSKKFPTPFIPEQMRKKIIYSVTEGKFYQRRMKAIASCLFLEINEIVPFLLELFLDEIKRIVKTKEEGLAYFRININTIQDLALALYFLSNDKKYLLFDSVAAVDMFLNEEKQKEVFEEIVKIVVQFSLEK